MPLKMFKYVLKIQNIPLKMHLCSIKTNLIIETIAWNQIKSFS